MILMLEGAGGGPFLAGKPDGVIVIGLRGALSESLRKSSALKKRTFAASPQLAYPTRGARVKRGNVYMTRTEMWSGWRSSTRPNGWRLPDLSSTP